MHNGEKIKKLRKELKLSQQELASMIGVTQSSIYLWEKGSRKPKLEQVIKLAEVLGVPVRYFGYETISIDGHSELFYAGDDKDDWKPTEKTPSKADVVKLFTVNDVFINMCREIVGETNDFAAFDTATPEGRKDARKHMAKSLLSSGLYFDKEEYSKEELEDIRKYAEFVKSKRKKD